FVYKYQRPSIVNSLLRAESDMRPRLLAYSLSANVVKGFSLFSLLRTSGSKWTNFSGRVLVAQRQVLLTVQGARRELTCLRERNVFLISQNGHRSRRRPLSATQHHPTTSLVDISFHC